LKAGDQLIIDETKDGWCHGRNESDESGWFPEAYIRVVGDNAAVEGKVLL